MKLNLFLSYPKCIKRFKNEKVLFGYFHITHFFKIGNKYLHEYYTLILIFSQCFRWKTQTMEVVFQREADWQILFFNFSFASSSR